MRMNQSGYLSMLPAKAVFAVNYFGSSAVYNFLNVFFNAYFDKFQIAILAAIPCFCAIVSPPLWGAIADMLHRQRWVHIFCLVTGCLFMFLIQFTSSSFYWTCFVVFLGNFQSLPTTSLLDQAVLALVERLGEEYGKQRLFGAVGWGFGAYFTGLVVSKFGILWAFYLHVLFLFPTVFLLQMIPASDSLDGSLSSPLDKSYSFKEGIQCVAKKKDVIILLFVVFLTGLMFGVLSSFLTLYLYVLSENSALIVGIAILCETLSELPAFYFADRIIEKLGIVTVLMISILCYGIRITFYAFMTNAWTALPFELLHGCTFSLAWAACTKVFVT
jgi:MFS family permease